MNTKQSERTQTARPPTEATVQGEVIPLAAGGLQLRLPYPRSLQEYAGINPRQWQVLIDAIWPSAKTVEGVCMAISYCRERNLDIMKKPVHIVPMYSRALEKEIETVWPGITEVRITATRTGVYGGKDACEFGPDVTKNFQHIDDRNDAIRKELEVTFPEWARVTVYKIVQGLRCAFVGPKVYWLEAYATENRFSPVPNEMWADRKSGQLEKCAEAAALRAAFPEELGGEYVAEEMHGKVIDGAPSSAAVVPTGEAVPPRPQRSEFERKPDVKKSEARTAEPAETKRVEETKPAEVKPAETHEQADPAENARKEFEEWLANQFDNLAKQKTEADLQELNEMVVEQLDDEQAATWKEAVAARLSEIAELNPPRSKEQLYGDLPKIVRIRDLGALRKEGEDALKGEDLKKWDADCDARQHQILEATRSPQRRK